MKKSIAFLVKNAFFCFLISILFVSPLCRVLAADEVSITVGTETVKRKIRPRLLSEVGTLSALQEVALAFETPGRVKAIFFQSGQLVQADDPLIALEDSVLAALVEKDKAAMKSARENFERMQTLFEHHIIAAAKFEDTKAALKSAAATLAGDEAKLRQMTLRAPFAGRLGLSQVSLGDYLQAGQSVAKLESISPIQVNFEINEIDISHIEVDTPLEVKTRSYPDEIYKGKIAAKDAAIDPETRMLKIRGTLSNEQGKLLPGMFVNVDMILKSQDSEILIPQTALIYQKTGTFVYLVKDNHARMVPVTLGERLSDEVIVLNGLAEGDILVVTGQIKLTEGALVKVLPSSL